MTQGSKLEKSQAQGTAGWCSRSCGLCVRERQTDTETTDRNREGGKGRGDGERGESASGREINLHTDKETGLPTRRSSGMERLKVHSWLLITASVTEKES